jgi:hypothetical protein
MRRSNGTTCTAVRPAALIGAVLVAGALTGCTADDPDTSATGAAPTTPAPATPSAEPTLMSLADHFTTYTEDTPPEIWPGLVLDQHGWGPDMFPLPDTSQYTSVVVLLTCEADGGSWGYAFLDAGGDHVSSGRGMDCTEELTAYKTPVYPADPPATIDVRVGAGVEYYVVVYGETAPLS